MCHIFRHAQTGNRATSSPESQPEASPPPTLLRRLGLVLALLAAFTFFRFQPQTSPNLLSWSYECRVLRAYDGTGIIHVRLFDETVPASVCAPCQPPACWAAPQPWPVFVSDPPVGSAYFFRLRAIDSDGIPGAWFAPTPQP